MPWIINRTSPLDRTATPVFVKPHTSLRAALTDRWPGFIEFSTPTLVTVDGVPRLRSTWDSSVSRTAVIECVALPAGAETLALISLAVTIASLLTTAYLIATMPSPVVPKGAIDIPPAAPVFTFAGQQNIRRLNQIIEKAYGKNRWWPAYLSAPYIEYANNKAVMRMWLSLGYGTFDVEDVMVNDTSLSQIPGASWQYRDAGFTVTTDDPYDVVVYAKDIANTELAGTNEDDYAIIGPYVISQDTYVLASRININVAFPGGLFTVGTTISTSTVTYAAQLQAVDANNNPTGSVQTFSFSHSASKTTPQRFTDSIEVTPGRYRISLYRTSLKDTTTSSQDRLVVESVCGLARSMKTYPVSALRVELLGSDAIGNDAASKVNLRAVAKVPTLDETLTWTDPVATRNPIWCFLDVFRAQYGASVPDDNLELAYYAELAEAYVNDTFDFFFNNKSTVWEAARVIAASFRAQPFIAGSDIRLTIDDPTNRPVAMFGPDNARNIEWTVSFAQQLDADCVDAAYVDAITGLQDTVRFTPPGSLGVNPEKISFDGVTDRTKAWQLAAYTHSVRTKRRQSVSFTTGLEGFIPLFGDIVTVGWNLPSWGVAGVVNAYVASTQIMEVSEPCDCNGTYAWLALRTSAGRPYGPVKVTQGVDLFHLHLETPLTQYFDFTGDSGTPVLFTFGVGQDYAKDIIVTRTSPSDDSVTVEGVLFAPEVFAYDSIDAPERGQDMLPFPVEAGAVPWIRVFEEDGAYLRVQWGVPQGSPTVTVEYAYNPLPATALTQQTPFGWAFAMVNVDDLFVTTAYVPREVGDLYIRVTTDDGVTVGEQTWRAYVGAFDAGLNRPFAATLANNVDSAYVAPLDPGNTAGTLAQAVALAPNGTARWDVGEKKLTVVVQGVNGAPVTVTVRATKGAGVAEVSGVIPGGSGTYTFTEDVLYAANLNVDDTTLNLGSPYADISIVVTGAGITTPLVIALDIEPLSNGAFGVAAVQYQARHSPQLSGVNTRLFGQTGPARSVGGLASFAVTATQYVGFARIEWKHGGGVLGAGAVYREDGGTTQFTAPCGPYVYVEGPGTTLGRHNIVVVTRGEYVIPVVPLPIVLVAYYNELAGNLAHTLVFPSGIVFGFAWNGGAIPAVDLGPLWEVYRQYDVDLQSNTLEDPDNFNISGAYYNYIQANKDKIYFLAVEYKFPPGTILDDVGGTTLDITHKRGRPLIDFIYQP